MTVFVRGPYFDRFNKNMTTSRKKLPVYRFCNFIKDLIPLIAFKIRSEKRIML